MRNERWLPRLFLLCMAALLCTALWQARQGWPVSSGLLDLLPQVASDPVLRQAQERVQAPLTHQLVALLGAPDKREAIRQARDLSQRWRQSGLFERVQVEFEPDLEQLRARLLAGRIAMLPPQARAQLEQRPQAYAEQRAREIGDPFSSASLIPLDQDWLGLARQAERALQPDTSLQLDPGSGMLLTRHDGLTWALVRTETRGRAFDQDSPPRLADYIGQEQQRLRADGARLLATGGILYAESGRSLAMREGGWISACSIAGIVLILLLALRSARALLSFIVVGCALLTGFVACVAAFGTIHVMTLVVGASLIGIVIDFPLHWLSKSQDMPVWQPWRALDRIRSSLRISLAANLLGYLALAFTPFPALTQIAVFSSAGLLGAYACTTCLLPALFRNWRPAVRPRRWLSYLLGQRDRLASRRGLQLAGAVLLAGFCAIGLARLDMRDDLRQWISLPAAMQDEARQIGAITGFMPTSQFFLVRAPDDDELLRRQARVAAALDTLKAEGGVGSYLALSQLLSPSDVQVRTRARLAELSAQAAPWQPFDTIGVPAAAIRNELLRLADTPVLDIPAALDAPWAEPWRDLWLGRQAGASVGLVTLQGLRTVAALDAIARAVPGVVLVDQNGELNRQFAATRTKAAELKAASYVLAAVLLLVVLGRSATWRILSVPLLSTACTVAMLGIVGQPLTLFSMFGLLLASAVAVDYAVFMQSGASSPPVLAFGVALSAATTLLSFGLLGLSSTPAVSNFGLTIALGAVFSLMATFLIVSPRTGAGTPAAVPQEAGE
ncbi:hypothetical protein PIGHUM_03458 [Pigmentiphaga humi]|uniref:MMPL family protein n=1 Tax=Pigmentiphaga humi TaxID=2478468 RepID=A0A3P4B890_9BURK|nr:hypothetical protein [Pigmentiphaga humi]VCU71375.1 hypothetical protein PIGHUM_03458 [Pigmentiphaga humi]